MAETIPHWNPRTQEWGTLTVDMPDEPRRRRTRRARTRRHGAPRDLTGLLSGSPIESWWRDTAFAPCDPLADLRTYVKPPAMRTHRTAVVMPSDPGRVTVTR